MERTRIQGVTLNPERVEHLNTMTDEEIVVLLLDRMTLGKFGSMPWVEMNAIRIQLGSKITYRLCIQSRVEFYKEFQKWLFGEWEVTLPEHLRKKVTCPRCHSVHITTTDWSFSVSDGWYNAQCQSCQKYFVASQTIPERR